MKETTIILAIFLLFLSLKPCSDGCNSNELHADDETSQKHDHQEDHDDTLVMCICNCCGMSLIYQPVLAQNLNLHSKIATEIFFIYRSNYRFNFLSNIWQPPQILG